MDVITENRIREVIEYLDARTPRKAPHTREDAFDEVFQYYMLERRGIMNNYKNTK